VNPEFDWNYWANAPSPPKAASSQKEVGPAQWGTVWPEGPNNDMLTTKLDSDTNLKAAHQQLSSTEFDKGYAAHADIPSLTDAYSYNPYPGLTVHAPSPGAGLNTVPDHEKVTPLSPGAGSPTVSDHDGMTPPSPNLGSPKEPENEVVPGPPSTPESTDPEFYSNSQSLSAGVHPDDLRNAIYGSEDLQAAMQAAKGKGKVSRSTSGTARDVGNAVQRELQSAERSP